MSAENRLKTTKKIWTFKYISGKQTENYKKSLNFQIYQRKTDWKLRKKSELSKISAENRLKTTKTNLNFQIYQRKTDWKPRKQIWSFKYNRPKTTKKSDLSNISEKNRLKTTKKIWTVKYISGNRLKTTKTNLNFQIY